jgi:hypothetical protein
MTLGNLQVGKTKEIVASSGFHRVQAGKSERHESGLPDSEQATQWQRGRSRFMLVHRTHS